MKLKKKLLLCLSTATVVPISLFSLTSCSAQTNTTFNHTSDNTPNQPAFNASQYTTFSSALNKSNQYFEEMYKDKNKLRAMLEKDISYLINSFLADGNNGPIPPPQKSEHKLEDMISLDMLDWTETKQPKYTQTVNYFVVKDNGYIDIEFETRLVEEGKIRISNNDYVGKTNFINKTKYINIKPRPIILNENNIYKLGWAIDIVNANLTSSTIKNGNFPTIPKKTNAYKSLNKEITIFENTDQDIINRTFINNKIFNYKNDFIVIGEKWFPSQTTFSWSKSIYLNIEFPLVDGDDNMFQLIEN